MKTPEQMKALQALMDELDIEMNLIDQSPVPVYSDKAAIQKRMSSLLQEIKPKYNEVKSPALEATKRMREQMKEMKEETPNNNSGCCGNCSGKCGK